MEIEPEDTFNEHIETRIRFSDLERKAIIKPWVLINNFFHHGLFYIPEKGPSLPITLSTDLSNGIYRIYILLGSPQDINFSPKQIGFQYRFNPRSSFVPPIQLDFLRRDFDQLFYYYLDLGETEVKENKFLVEVLFQPPGDEIYVIRHVKFVPAGSLNRELLKAGETEELRRRSENLKSLGYL